MPINPNIAMGFQTPQIESPFNAMARMAQLEAANQESQLNALRARGIETTMREDDNFRNALKGGGDYSDPEVQRNLLAANPARAIDLFKNLAERNKSTAEANRIRAETADRVLGTYRAMLPGIQTPEEMAEWYRHQRGRKELEDTPVFAHSLEQKIAAIPRDPVKFAEFKAQVEMGMDKYLTVNRGIATAPGGAVQSPFSYGVQTPANPAATEAKPDIYYPPPVPGQPPVVVYSRPPANPGGLPTAVAAPIQNAPVTSAETPAQAKAREKAELAQREKTASLDAFKGELDNTRFAYGELDRLRAIPSTERGALSNLSAAAGASGVGQVVSRALGTEEQTNRDIIAGSRLRLLNAVAKVLGVKSGQLNSNVELQTYLNSLSDPKQSIQAVEANIANLEAFIERNLGEAPSEPPPKTTAPKTVAPKPAALKLPKPGDVVDGYRFIGGAPNDQKNWVKQ